MTNVWLFEKNIDDFENFEKKQWIGYWPFNVIQIACKIFFAYNCKKDIWGLQIKRDTLYVK